MKKFLLTVVFVLIASFAGAEKLTIQDVETAFERLKHPSNITIQVDACGQVNAFTANGHIIICQEFLDILDTQNEVAIIVGHEIAHNVVRYIHNDILNELFYYTGLSDYMINEISMDIAGMMLVEDAGYELPQEVTLVKAMKSIKNSEEDIELNIRAMVNKMYTKEKAVFGPIEIVKRYDNR